jgi:hypothetical protein
MRQTKRALLVLAVAYAAMGSECINDPFVVSVNVEALEAVINIPAGSTTTFAGVTTISADEYFTTDVGAIQNLRIYDITVQSVGSYGGTVTGTSTVNGATLVSYSGPWSSFATPKSLLAPSSGVTLTAAGVTALRTAVLGQQNVTLAAGGTLSTSPVPALQLIIKLYAQVDAEP